MFSQKIYKKFVEPVFDCVSKGIRKWRLYGQYTFLFLNVLKIAFSTRKTLIMYGHNVYAKRLTAM